MATTIQTRVVHPAAPLPSAQPGALHSPRPSRPNLHSPLPSQRSSSVVPPASPSPTLVRRSFIDYSKPLDSAAAPPEPTPEQQLAEQLRFVRGGPQGDRRARQPLYRPAVLRRTDSQHLSSGTGTSVAPTPSLFPPPIGSHLPPLPHHHAQSGTATPVPRSTGSGSGSGSGPSSPLQSAEPHLLSFPDPTAHPSSHRREVSGAGGPGFGNLSRKGSLASSTTSLPVFRTTGTQGAATPTSELPAFFSGGEDEGDAGSIRSATVGGTAQGARCGSALVNGKLVGRMMDKADWTPDSFRTFCSSDRCPKRFSLFDRKHHCRLCGEVFCSGCSSTRLDLLPPARRGSGGAGFSSGGEDATPTLGPRREVGLPGSPKSTFTDSIEASSPSSAAELSQQRRRDAPAELEPNCRVCDTCASSLALGIDPLATRVRKPLLESSPVSLVSPISAGALDLAGSRSSMTPPPLPVPGMGIHAYTQSANVSPSGSLHRQHPGPPGRKMSNSDPNVRSASSGGSGSGSGESSSSHYTLATPPSAHSSATTVSSTTTPGGQHSQPRVTAAGGKGFYHPFPQGPDSQALFASPSDERALPFLTDDMRPDAGLGQGRIRGGRTGGAVIPQHGHFGQVWSDPDAPRSFDDFADVVGPGFEDLGGGNPHVVHRRLLASAMAFPGDKSRDRLWVGPEDGVGSLNREEEGTTAFSYQWSTF